MNFFTNNLKKKTHKPLTDISLHTAAFNSIANYFLILKNLERAVVKQLIDYLQRKGLFEVF